jgi:hypothetical protein
MAVQPGQDGGKLDVFGRQQVLIHSNGCRCGGCEFISSWGDILIGHGVGGCKKRKECKAKQNCQKCSRVPDMTPTIGDISGSEYGSDVAI